MHSGSRQSTAPLTMSQTTRPSPHILLPHSPVTPALQRPATTTSLWAHRRHHASSSSRLDCPTAAKPLSWTQSQPTMKSKSISFSEIDFVLRADMAAQVAHVLCPASPRTTALFPTPASRQPVDSLFPRLYLHHSSASSSAGGQGVCPSGEVLVLKPISSDSFDWFQSDE
jgi:hypothetical protein